jgi:hypothetical protein
MFWRVAGALIVSPIVVSLGMVLTTRPASGSLEDQAFEALFVAFVFYLYPFFFALIFALPLYLLLNRHGLVNWWVSLAAGLLIGAIGAASLFDQGLWSGGRLVLLGGIAGLVFWRIVSTYRPPKATW